MDGPAENPSPSARASGASASSHASVYEPATFVPLACTPDALTINIAPALPPAPCAKETSLWQQACAHNPRLFNGPILRYLSCDAQGCAITAARESYLRYAVQQNGSSKAHKHDPRTPDNALYQLAVTGVLVQADAAGHAHVLLGKRAKDTWVYPDLWELAPAGGLENADYLGQLEIEMHEELGHLCQDVQLCAATKPRTRAAPAPHALCSVLGLTLDPNTPSADIIVRVDLPAAHECLPTACRADDAWEYAAVRWVEIADLRRVVASQADLIIPPTRAVLQALGWLDQRA